MVVDGTVGLFLGVIGLGAAHGILPDHGWPVAAMYAINKERTWLHGFLSGFVLGFGHLVSSITVVFVYFWALTYFDLTEIGGLNYVAGGLLVILGVREYLRGGHSHDQADSSGTHHHGALDHSGHGGHDHSGSEGHDDTGEKDIDSSHLTNADNWSTRIRRAIPFLGDTESHSNQSSLEEQADQRGLYGIALFAFALGFAHNEEIEIIAICTGSTRCLELMAAYALAVLFAVILMTLLLVAGYERSKTRVERYEHLIPTVTAAVLIIMGLGFIAGIF